MAAAAAGSLCGAFRVVDLLCFLAAAAAAETTTTIDAATGDDDVAVENVDGGGAAGDVGGVAPAAVGASWMAAATDYVKET